MSELNEKIDKLERHLRGQNDGNMPQMPKTIHEQLEQFLQATEDKPKSSKKQNNSN